MLSDCLLCLNGLAKQQIIMTAAGKTGRQQTDMVAPSQLQ